MQQYILKRALLFIPTIILVTVLVFALMRMIPGDPAFLILAGGGEGNFTQEELDNLRHELGTDRHILVQYGDWLWGLLQGDMGTALFYGTSVTSELGPRVPLTIELAVMAAIISFILAVPLGMISALKQDSWFDYAARDLYLHRHQHTHIRHRAGGGVPAGAIVRLVPSAGIRPDLGGPAHQPAAADIPGPHPGVLPAEFHGQGDQISNAGGDAG